MFGVFNWLRHKYNGRVQHYVYDDFVMAVARQLRKLRKQQGYTQKSFSAACGWDQGHWSNIERGEKMSLKTLVRAANSLNVSVQDLVDTAARKEGAGEGSPGSAQGKAKPAGLRENNPDPQE